MTPDALMERVAAHRDELASIDGLRSEQVSDEELLMAQSLTEHGVSLSAIQRSGRVFGSAVWNAIREAVRSRSSSPTPTVPPSVAAWTAGYPPTRARTRPAPGIGNEGCVTLDEIQSFGARRSR